MTDHTVIIPTRTLSIINRDGEVVDIDLSPVSLETAGIRLPQIQRAIKILRDHATFLEGVITSSFIEGQTEKRIGDQLYEYKPEAEWIVTDEMAMAEILADAHHNGDITDDEYLRVYQESVVRRFNHASLNVLSKRLPRINDLRHRVEGQAKLRIKK